MKQLYKEIILFASNEYENYKYLGLNKEKYILMIKKQLNELSLSEINMCNSSIDVLKHVVKNYFKKLSNDIKINIIDSYINEIFKKTDNIDEAFNQLKKLSIFLSELRYSPKINTIIKLIEKNNILLNDLNITVNENLDLINKGNLDLIIRDSMLISFIEAFCIINNIETEQITDKETNNFISDSTDAYLEELKSYPQLTTEENKLLFERLAKGDTQARNLIVEGNLKLVVFFAKKYTNRYEKMDFLDHLQNGNIGLMTAIEKFDVTKGYSFATYAGYWIKQSIERSIANTSRTIRVSVQKFYKIKNLLKREEELAQKLNREPTINEMATELEISVSELRELYKFKKDSTSLNIFIENEDECSVENVLHTNDNPTEEEFIEKTLSDEVNKLLTLCNLTEIEIAILRHVNGVNCKTTTLESIGEKYNITRERVRQIEAEAYRKIRNSKYIKHLTVYMDKPEASAKFIDLCRDEYIKKPRNTKKFTQEYFKEELLNPKQRTIYELLSGTEEEINKMLLKVQKDPIIAKMIFLKWGSDMHNPETQEEFEENQEFFNTKIMPKMRRKLLRIQKQKKQL